jgi:DNA polymerase I-like protein with 3'-5' exonuclease and polymerase domains
VKSDASGFVADVETTMRSPIGNEASPFWPHNYIVSIGTKCVGGTSDGEYFTARYEEAYKPPSCADPTLIIGHNVGFDIHYLLKHDYFEQNDLGKCLVWDTQLAEYLLTAQQAKFASLDEVSVKYGGTFKDDKMKEHFAKGEGADTADPDVLAQYQKADVDNTYKVFVGQYAAAEERGMLPLIWNQMDAKLACIEMTYNGMAVDVDFLNEQLKIKTAVLAEVDKRLTALFHRVHPNLKHTSPKDAGVALFGGEVKVMIDESVGTYKNGKPKHRKRTVTKEVHGTAQVALSERLKNGTWATTDAVLGRVIDDTYGKYTTPTARIIASELRAYRELSKEVNTYYKNAIELTFPDGRIHGNLNQCLSVTGRLTSSEPNLQNITDKSKSNIKNAYISRWGDDGVIIDVDYSQLEMVALAILSGDERLKEDIRKGVDMHTELYKALFSRAPTKEERRPFKRCSFCLVYGGGPKAISEQGGITIGQAKGFIEAFYARYPGVKRFHENLIADVSSCRYHAGRRDTETDLPYGESYYVNDYTHRVLHFREYPSLWLKGECAFSPTEIKNYPVQSFATADIVPMMFGKLFRVLKNNKKLRNKCLLINTVHDNVMLDCHKSALQEALPLIKSVLESVVQVFQETFGHTLDMPFNVNVSYGRSWGEQVDWNEDLAMKEAA